MNDEAKIVAEQNPYNGTWDVGWKWEDGDFTAQFCGYAAKEEAEAQIPGFDERVERELQAFMAKQQAENEEWPNLGHVRQQINKLVERGKNDQAFDASQKLNWLIDVGANYERIRWPLPSWTAIRSGQAYRR